MTRRWKTAVALCAAAATMSSGAAFAHDPDLMGDDLVSPFGEHFSLIANFQTAADPQPSSRNPHVTSSDIAFWGDYAFVGDYGGFRIFDISKPTPKLVGDERCYGPQGDPSVFDTNGDDKPDVLALSVDSVLASSNCGALPVGKPPVSQQVPDPDYPAGAWEGLRIFDISNLSDPKQIAAVYLDCGSHTNTLLPNPKGGSMYIMNSSYPLGEGPSCGPEGTEPDNPINNRKRNHGVVQVVEVPFANPAAAKELVELPVVYPGDADGTYKPVSEQGIVAPLDDFLGCHDLSVFPAKGIVGAACGEQAQVWKINRATGLPDTTNPVWSYDQPNVDFWHSATFSWDGKVANFIDESFGDGCPTKTSKTGGTPGGVKVFETGNMFFFDTDSGELYSEYRNPRETNGDSLDPNNPERLTYCSSHLGLPVPSSDRYLLVDAYYRGGTSVIDFSNPSKPKEIAYADLTGTNTWSAYPYTRETEKSKVIDVYSNDGLSRDYDPAPGPAQRYPEAAYGFQRFQADVGNVTQIGLDRLNPQLQERLVATRGLPRGEANGKPRAGSNGAKSSGSRIRGARPFTK